MPVTGERQWRLYALDGYEVDLPEPHTLAAARAHLATMPAHLAAGFRLVRVVVESVETAVENAERVGREANG